VVEKIVWMEDGRWKSDDGSLEILPQTSENLCNLWEIKFWKRDDGNLKYANICWE
jgi:hypothetical protein